MGSNWPQAQSEPTGDLIAKIVQEEGRSFQNWEGLGWPKGSEGTVLELAQLCSQLWRAGSPLSLETSASPAPVGENRVGQKQVPARRRAGWMRVVVNAAF